MVTNFAALGLLTAIHADRRRPQSDSRPFRTPMRSLAGVLAVAAAVLLAIAVDITVVRADDYAVRPHLGVQAESTDELSEVYGRLKAAEGPVLDEGRTTCCYARSEKSWIAGGRVRHPLFDPAGEEFVGVGVGLEAEAAAVFNGHGRFLVEKAF